MTETGESVGAVSPFRFLGRSLFVDVALPWLTVRILEAHGVPTVWALAVAALFPGASTLMSWVSGRRVEAGTYRLTFGTGAYHRARKIAALLHALGRTHNLKDAFAAVYPGDLAGFQQQLLRQLSG